MRATLTGFRFWDDRTALFRWGEVSRGWGLALELINWGEDRDWSLHFTLIYFQFYIKLPFLPTRHVNPDNMSDHWGFSWRWGREWGNGDSITFEWGPSRRKTLYMPWGWTFHRKSILMPDGRSWVHEIEGYNVRHGEVPVEHPTSDHYWTFNDLPHWEIALPYQYVLRNGEVQKRTAMISVDEMEWRMRWFKWAPWPRLIRRSIDVKFSDEVGERSGSWKGGCVGCGYELRQDETAEECLRRMERERKF